MAKRGLFTENTTSKEVTQVVDQDTLLAETVIKNANRLGTKLMAEVPISLMRVDDSYQRVVQNNVKKLMRNWEDEKCQALIVSYRDNRFYIMDGQHRYVVAKAKGLSHLVCEIWEGLNQMEEAKRFSAQNDNITRLTPYDTYKANIVYKEPIDMAIKSVCDRHHITVKKSGKSKNLKSVSSARNIVRNIGENGLDWIFDVISDAKWEDFSQAYGGDMIESLAYTMQMNMENLSAAKKNLIRAFKETNPTEIVAIGNAKYPNYGRRTRLKLTLNQLAKGEQLDNIKVA